MSCPRCPNSPFALDAVVSSGLPARGRCKRAHFLSAISLIMTFNDVKHRRIARHIFCFMFISDPNDKFILSVLCITVPLCAPLAVANGLASCHNTCRFFMKLSTAKFVAPGNTFSAGLLCLLVFRTQPLELRPKVAFLSKWRTKLSRIES